METINAHGLVGHLGRGAAPRELECLLGVAAGLSGKQVAKEMGVAPSSVEKRLLALSTKLGVTKRAAMVATAFARGIIAMAGSPFPTGPNHQDETEHHGVLIA